MRSAAARPACTKYYLWEGALFFAAIDIVAHMVVDSADDEYDGSPRVSRLALRSAPRPYPSPNRSPCVPDNASHPIASLLLWFGIRLRVGPRLFDITRVEFCLFSPSVLRPPSCHWNAIFGRYQSYQPRLKTKPGKVRGSFPMRML